MQIQVEICRTNSGEETGPAATAIQSWEKMDIWVCLKIGYIPKQIAI